MTGNAAIVSHSRELPLDPGGSVEIVLAASDLRVRGIDGDRVVVRSRDGKPLDDRVHFETAPGVVRILDGEGSFRDGEGGFKLGPVQVRIRRSPDLDIELPRTAVVSLRTTSGDVEAHGIGGASRWASTSGDLRVSVTAGPVHLDTMSGDAALESSVDIVLTARTVSGDLKVRAPRLETLDATTTSGDIRVEGDLAPDARHIISSVSGDVDVITGSPVRLEAQTIAGDVRATGPHSTEGGQGRRTLIVGKGSVPLAVRTTSGDVRLRIVSGTRNLAPRLPVAAAAPPAPASQVAPVPQPAPEAPAPPELAVQPPAFAPAGLPRPLGEEDTQAWNAAEPAIDRREADRLDVLRALERGDVDIETASRHLEALDEAGLLSFRGWC